MYFPPSGLLDKTSISDPSDPLRKIFRKKKYNALSYQVLHDLFQTLIWNWEHLINIVADQETPKKQEAKNAI